MRRRGPAWPREERLARVSGLPTPWLIGLRVYSQAGEDGHGNPVESWAAPVPVPVHGVAPQTSLEPMEPGRYLVVETLTVYAPAGTVVGEHDRVVWPYRDGMPEVEWVSYDVDGPLADWTTGPWPHPIAGVTFNLNLTKG